MPNTFDSPFWLLLLPLVPAYWYWYLRVYDRKRLVIRLSYDPARLHQPPAYTALLRWMVPIFQSLALLCLILALARPQQVRQQATNEQEGIDIMLVLDVSESMGAEDLQPSRLEAAKQQAITFVGGRISDRIGIVLFAEEALGYAPTTYDHDFLAELLRKVTIGMLPKQGTAVGDAIAVGINRLETEENRPKVMLLITDGVANRGQIDPITAARLARLARIRIYTIGVGQSEFMAQTATGTRLMRSDLDETTLRKVAEIAGGKYFRATDPQSMSRIFEEISSLETSAFAGETIRIARDVYPAFLQLGLACFIAALGLMLTFAYNPLEQ